MLCNVMPLGEQNSLEGGHPARSAFSGSEVTGREGVGSLAGCRDPDPESASLPVVAATSLTALA